MGRQEGAGAGDEARREGLLTSVAALLDLPSFDGSNELMDSLDVIADETQRVVALLPQAPSAS